MPNTGSQNFNTSRTGDLFGGLSEVAETPAVNEAAVSKSVIDKILKVRRSLSAAEQEFALPKINLLIEELRSMVRMTPTQREEQVLYSIERQGATTETEIAEDTRLHRSKVREIIESLVQKNILYLVRKTVVGSDRPQFAIKSRRLETPEAGEVFNRPGE